MLRLKFIGCKILYREISLISARCENIIDTTFIRQGLHNTPTKLNKILQKEIDKIDNGDDIYSYQKSNGEANLENDFDAILLGYGLCSNAILGLKSSKYKLVIPKAHDCITLFLGSKEKYKNYFDDNNGRIYWYTRGWLENCPMPSKQNMEKLMKEYTDRYGEENAEYLINIEHSWINDYRLCNFIYWKELISENYINEAREAASYFNWKFSAIEGTSNLLENFLNGNWSSEDFITVDAGTTITEALLSFYYYK